MPSITSANDVCAIDADMMSVSERTLATGRLALTDHTACWISFTSVVDFGRSVRITYASVRCARRSGDQSFSTSTGQYTVVGAGCARPWSRSSPTTPTIVRHGLSGELRMRRPIAFAGSPQYSRARFSLTTTLFSLLYESFQVSARPATTRLPMTEK